MIAIMRLASVTDDDDDAGGDTAARVRHAIMITMMWCDEMLRCVCLFVRAFVQVCVSVCVLS